MTRDLPRRLLPLALLAFAVTRQAHATTAANMACQALSPPGQCVVSTPVTVSAGSPLDSRPLTLVLTSAGTLDAGGGVMFVKDVSVDAVGPISFLACDVAPARVDLDGDGDTLDAGEFGNGLINNADIVQLFRASLLGPPVRPPAGSDLFSAMDAAPEDRPPVCGGNGSIVNNDVVLCFRRSLLPALPRYTRSRDASTCRSALVALGSVSFAGDVQPLFTANCAFPGCHAGPFPAQGLDLSAGHAYGDLVNVASGECALFRRVLPGQPTMSYLVFKIAGPPQPCFSGAQMPSGRPPLAVADQDTISNWILQGAVNN